MLANKLRHAPATGLLTSDFSMNDTDTSVPNPPSCLAIGDNSPENRCQRSRGTAGQPFSGGQNRYKWGVFTDHPDEAMIDYAPLPRQVLHTWPVRGG
jgi:hypothetical protein